MKFDELFMEIAEVCAKRSHDPSRKVGCVITQDSRVISMGWNGLPAGMEGECKDCSGKTRPEVVHAEANAIAYLARSTASSEGATLFCTLSPCIDCAKLILQAGITRVVYKDSWRCDAGIKFLKERLGNDNISRLSSGEDPQR